MAIHEFSFTVSTLHITDVQDCMRARMRGVCEAIKVQDVIELEIHAIRVPMLLDGSPLTFRDGLVFLLVPVCNLQCPHTEYVSYLIRLAVTYKTSSNIPAPRERLAATPCSPLQRLPRHECAHLLISFVCASSPVALSHHPRSRALSTSPAKGKAFVLC